MAENTENLILETARKRFVQNGFAATRMQDIADEAGINKAMLHYYYRSKEKLYHQIVNNTLDIILPKFAESFQKEGEFWEKLENIVETYLSTLLENPEFPIFIMSELSQRREKFILELKNRASFFPAFQNFIMLLNHEMEKGNIKKFPPFQLFLNILGMMVFPFMAKPVFLTVFDFSEENFNSLMKERKDIIMQFLKEALKTDN